MIDMDVVEITEWAKSLSLFVGSKPSSENHVFVTGVPRSGTTLVKEVLTVHPALAGPDYESTGLFKLRNLFAYSSGEINNGWIEFEPEKARHFVDLYDELARDLCAVYEGEVFVDKVWPARIRLMLLVDWFPEARWIHLVRDGRDSYCSALTHPNIPQSDSLRRFASYWKRGNRLIRSVVPGSRKYQLRYEDLTVRTNEVVTEMMTFLSLDVVEAQFAPGDTGRTSSMRKRAHHERLSQPIDDRSVGRYRDEMNQAQIHEFERIARSDLDRYGYL